MMLGPGVLMAKSFLLGGYFGVFCLFCFFYFLSSKDS